MKRVFATVCVLAGLMISGCAGVQNKKNLLITESLPDEISESFHFNVQDLSARRYLTITDPANFPPDQRLEIIVLRELAQIPSEKELPHVFDNLWEQHEEIRDIVRQPGKKEGFIRPLAEIYYLLSDAGAEGWRGRIAERIYTEKLCRVRPHEISGYALHFYTLALLKNGKFEVALHFLKRIDSLVSPSIYLKDITIAMDYALEGNAYPIVCRLMADICTVSAENGLPDPDAQLKFAIRSLRKAGQLALARKMLMPVLRQYPKLRECSLAGLLSADGAPEKWPGKNFLSMSQTARAEDSVSFSGENSIARLGSTSGKEKVRIDVQVIKAEQGPDYIDPELKDIGRSLKKTLNFSSFHLIGRKFMNLRVGEMGSLRLLTGDNLQITLRSYTPEQFRIEVTIKNRQKQVFHTFFDSVDGGIAIIGGPKTGDKVILLRITTYNAKINSGKENPVALDKADKKNFQFSTYLC